MTIYREDGIRLYASWGLIAKWPRIYRAASPGAARHRAHRTNPHQVLVTPQMREPTTEAGKRLLGVLDKMTAEFGTTPSGRQRYHEEDAASILAIEAEARAQGALHENLAGEGDIERAVEQERARIRAAVEALPKWDKRSVPGGFHVNLSAVLALIDRSKP